jgi:hypothetical protein
MKRQARFTSGLHQKQGLGILGTPYLIICPLFMAWLLTVKHFTNKIQRKFPPFLNRVSALKGL